MDFFASSRGNPECDESISHISSMTRLHKAALGGDLSLVNTLIQEGSNVNALNDEQLTPLHLAACQKHVCIVQALISAGADVNAPFPMGGTPLICAIQSNSLPIVEILVKNGANLDVKTSEGFSNLHLAALQNCADMAAYLIDRGVDIDVRCTHPKRLGITPLHSAASKRAVEVVQLLLAKGANVNAQACVPLENSRQLKKNITPLHMVTQLNYLDIVKMLIKSGADINAKDSLMLTPLHVACVNGFLGIVKYLLSKSCQVNGHNVGFYAPLHLATKRGDKEIVKALLNAANIDVNIRGPRADTPLHIAIEDGRHLDIMKLLIANGADINAEHEGGITPLHMALCQNRFDVIDFLIENNPDVNIQDEYSKCTPFHLSAGLHRNMKADSELTEKLLKCGADVRLKNRENQTVLHKAVLNLSPNSINLIISKGADVNAKMNRGKTPLHLAAKAARLNIVKLLLEKGAYFDDKTDKGELPIELARKKAAKSSVAATIVQLLDETEKLFRSVIEHNCSEMKHCIKEGAVVSVRKSSGWTAIMHAVNNGYSDAVAVLLANQADIFPVTHKVNSVLHLTVNTGRKEILNILLQHAKKSSPAGKLKDFINGKTSAKNTTPLHIAAEKNDVAAVKLLLESGAIYNARNSDGKTPSELCQNETIKQLMRTVAQLFDGVDMNGIDSAVELSKIEKAILNARDNEDGCTLLCKSIWKGHVDDALALLRAGADCTLITNTGESALHIASSKASCLYVVKALLEQARSFDDNRYGEYINASSPTTGSTALHVASSVKIAKQLLRYGAIYDIQNNEGKTPYDVTCIKKIRDFLRLINEVFEVAKKGNAEKAGIMDSLDENDREAVCHACNSEGKKVIEIRLSNHKPTANKLLKAYLEKDGFFNVTVHENPMDFIKFL